jgi:hypothetical protein
MIVTGERAILLASNDESQVPIEFEPGENSSFRLVRSPLADQWRKRLGVEPVFKPVCFGAGRFQLTLHGNPHASRHDGQLVVVDRTSPKAREILLTQNTTEANEQIGAWQIVDDAPRVAKTFYDAEAAGSGISTRPPESTRSFLPKRFAGIR